MRISQLFHFPESKSACDGYPRLPAVLINSHHPLVYVNSMLAVYVIPYSSSRHTSILNPTRHRLNVRHWLRESHWVNDVPLGSKGSLPSIRCAAARPIQRSADVLAISTLPFRTDVPLVDSQYPRIANNRQPSSQKAKHAHAPLSRLARQLRRRTLRGTHS